MKRKVFFWFVSSVVSAAVFSGFMANAQNPICQTHFTPDPAPLVVGDTLYLYTGCDDISADPDNFVMREYLCFTTTDMVNWTHHAPVFNNEGFGTKDCAYAAQMAYRNGKYYYYTSTFGIPVLVSDSPYGPFTNPLGGKKFLINSEDTNYSGHGWEDIDPTVLIDDDGQAYMYWGNNALYAVKLNEDMISYDGDIKVFEIKDKEAFGPDYEEAPWLAKRGDKYYLAYASFCPEATDWAWADSPLGPWKYGGQLMRAFEHGGMGNHTGMCEYKGQWYFFYMDEGLPEAHSKRRTTSVIPFEFNEDGSLPYMHHDKRGVLKSVRPLNPYLRQQGETIAWEEGIGIGYDNIHCVYVNDIDPGDWIKVREVNFEEGAKSFNARVRNGKTGSKIEIHLDAPNGELIGVVDCASGKDWKEVECDIKQRDGIHDLYFVFAGDGHELMDFDSWQFTKMAFGPTPSANQLKWQDMETYAFIHYSLNTYTDQEWGFGDESPALFNPSDLDVKQWVKVCKDAGMKGIIFTAKHHCGFCMWPSAYTEYSVKNSPWKDGKGDVVRELAEACREAGLKFAVYLSPWDRNHPEYGRDEYVAYFKNQLEELLTNYGDVFEVWFDGANGGDGWYGGANEIRKIDRTTYYQWPETYRMIRRIQPNCLIWNDGSDRGDLRWVGTEAGEVGATNWSLLNKDGETDWGMLHFGLENGDSWVPGETNTSIRPGWFYHTTEDENVKSLSKLMDTYYKSVGRNSTLLLNFPIMPNGRIHPTDSIRGAAFAKMVKEVFKDDLALNAKTDNPEVNDGDRNTYWMPEGEASTGEVILSFEEPVTFNRFVAEEYIPLGQRVKAWEIEAFSGGKWIPLKDALTEDGKLTTIGRKRIVCFPTVTADKVRFKVTDSKAVPLISGLSVYNAPELTADIPDSGEKRCSNLRIFYMSPKQMAIELGGEKNISGIRYLPPTLSKEGTVTHYSVYATTDWSNWTKVASGEFSNIVNNPIWQTVKFDPVKASVLRIEADRISEGEHMAYSDVEILYE